VCRMPFCLGLGLDPKRAGRGKGSGHEAGGGLVEGSGRGFSARALLERLRSARECVGPWQAWRGHRVGVLPVPRRPVAAPSVNREP
jgi:hypothetical protein